MNQIFTDLHIHSKYSRGTSKKISLDSLAKGAETKGIDILGTGDFTHPKWLAELRTKLNDNQNGIYNYDTGNFLLSTELSLIYTKSGTKKVHFVILAPDFEIVDQINEWLDTKGRRDYDGRPIFGFSSEELIEQLVGISNQIEIIPAHCLTPHSLIHTDHGIKEIKNVKKGDLVLTHRGRIEPVKKVHSRVYEGKILKIVPAYFKENCFLTPEHPVYAIKTFKLCKNASHTICKPTCAYLERGCSKKAFKNYIPEWIPAKNLERGDIILYPRFKKTEDMDFLHLNDLLPQFYTKNKYIVPRDGKVSSKNIPIKNKIYITEDFCRLVGYYLAEGYISKDRISFTFNKTEEKYIQDVKDILISVFGTNMKFYEEEERNNAYTLSVHSKILVEFFKQFYSSNTYRSFTKKVPSWIMALPKNKQKHLIIGWWRGDSGYTTSKSLVNQIKIIFLRLGIIPSIFKVSCKSVLKRRKNKPCRIEGRKIHANRGCYDFHNLSFFAENCDLLELPEFEKFKTKLSRRRGWIDEYYVYLPIRKIEEEKFKGKVLNLEVNEDNSYVTEAIAVHNCWTPWFSLFGSRSGFDSLEEAFGSKKKHIHALETGLSSDPEMNWRLSQLDDFALVSNSDAHSHYPWRLGREATVFDLEEPSYEAIINAIRSDSIDFTIEVDPSYGKYHLDGHRRCDVCLEPKKSQQLNNKCPQCGRQLTIGVLHRVEELADRPEGYQPKDRPQFKRLIPLHELIATSLDMSISTKTVASKYNAFIEKFGSEYEVLLNAPANELEQIDRKLAQLIIKNRNNNIKVKPGYDGVYGKPILKEEGLSGFV